MGYRPAVTADTERAFAARLHFSSAGSPATAFRATLLVLCSALSAFSAQRTYSAVPIAVLAAFAVAAERVPAIRRHPAVAMIAEASGTGLAVALTGGAQSPMLPYLLAPGLAMGLAGTWRQVCLVTAGSAVGLGAGRVLYELGADAVVDQALPVFARNTGLWVLLGLAFGLVAGWAQRLQAVPVDPGVQVQQAAHRLLLQLRSVARRLPGSLDPASTAEALLLDLQTHLPMSQAWVLVRGAGGEGLVPIASIGSRTLGWDVSLATDSALAEAWASQQPVLRSAGHRLPAGGRSPGPALALPLTLGTSVFGIVAIEVGPATILTSQEVDEAARRVAAVALSLDTGLLFGEVRASATTEERLRLSREIHDGIAQELTSLGYSIDELTAEAADSPLRPHLSAVRAEITRLVTDLRMSLFDLRSGVDVDTGLGAALSEHVRRVGSSTGLTVHLSLSEGPVRLPPQSEAELLRMAQEAINNARRHSGGRNLWVRCDIDPPNALLVIEDDGRGIAGPTSADSYGLLGMAERAARLKADLVIGPRADGPGTRVCVALGTVSPSQPR